MNSSEAYLISSNDLEMRATRCNICPSLGGPIDIALAADGGYFCGLLVTACSIAKYASVNALLRFNVLDGGVCDDDWRLLKQKVGSLHKKVEFRRLLVNDEMFGEYPAWKGNKMAYARLILPSALSGIDWCIYCDVDFLWLNDVAELWSQRDDRYALISTKDGTQSTIDQEKAWFNKYNYQFDPETYFCSGLCFFNLKAFREEKIISAVADVLRKHNDMQFPDQAALNIVLQGKVCLVSPKWQRFSCDVTGEDLVERCAIHYAGEAPWRRLGLWINTITDTMIIWHRFYARLFGISTWASLRKWYGAGEIIRRRLLFYVVATPIIREIFFAMLTILKRRVYIPALKRWNRKISVNV